MNNPVKSPTLCLNMIVKNESKILRRLLQSVSPIIDSYCICDTGSTDDTVSIIEAFFREHKLPGKIIREPFRDFGYNRTLALQACENEPLADYILLLDADMIFSLQVTPEVFKQQLVHDIYCMFQGNDAFYYKNVRIIKNNRGCTYWGVTHEYLKSPPNSTHSTIDKNIAFIRDIGDGGSKGDKWERDISLLKQGLVDLPNNDRYTFYLANTYHDAGKYELAIETYKRRVQLGGWHEEVWYSHYRIGIAYARMGNVTMAIAAWMDAYDVFPNRVENLYEIVKNYRILGKHKIAQMFYQLARKSMKDHPERDYLFMHNDVYEWKLDYEFTILAYYTNPENTPIIPLCMQVAANPQIDDASLRNILSNYKFYTPILNTLARPSIHTDLLQSIGDNLDIPSEFVPSTPSLALNHLGELLVNVRYVNYSIDDRGNYSNRGKIHTINVVATVDIRDVTWQIKNQKILLYNTKHDDFYVGLEDVRLLSHHQKIIYNANRGLKDGIMVVEHGVIDYCMCKDERFLKKDEQRDIEKNWVLFANAGGVIHCIYGWYPLTIGTIGSEGEFSTVATHKMPSFFKHVRGSTNGQIIGDEVWFLCHSVSYEDRRYYYHLFVVVDASTFVLKKYTPWFVFEKMPVEYSLGFVILPGTERFLIGYSTMDRTTQYMELEKSVVDAMMILV
uniref:Glycosyltransferase 2-like domain-containing protein n=1 Tax=viral metagenome TaxID=1070528 RepID=A0A6C0KJX4_9ZZZZ